MAEARLQGAKLDGAVLLRASLSGAELSGASLRGAFLSETDLRGAELARADLSGADLSGALGLTQFQLSAACGAHAVSTERRLRRRDDAPAALLHPAPL